MQHYTADDGSPIYLQISGEGPPLLLLHGWTASHAEWFPFLPALESHFRVYRWDARGHGGHPARGEPPTVQRMARDLDNLIETFDLHQVAAVGHSMGALTLWQYLRDYGSARLAHLCFIDQSPKLMTDSGWPYGIYGDFGAARATEMMQSLRTDFAEAVLKLTAFGLNRRAREKYLENAAGWQRSREALRRLEAGPLIECWASLTAADYRDVLERIDVPSLLIYGGESNFYGAGTAHHVANRIPDAILHIYEGTDHSPHQWRRERFIADLLEFLGFSPA